MSDTQPKKEKLYMELSAEQHKDVPLSLLLAARNPYTFSEYPTAFLLAVEMDSMTESRHDTLVSGTCNA